MDDIFKGTTALVTGASSGMGEHFARQLAARGANLVVAARTASKLEALAAELAKAHAVTAEALPVDLGVPGGADRLCDELKKRGRTIDHLISNAGFGVFTPFVQQDPDRDVGMLRLNIEAVTMLAHHLLPGMIERRRGGVINVSSIAAFQAVPGFATYAASKAFVLSLTVALAEEARGTGVRVMVLCPGPVPTGFQKTAGVGIGKSQETAAISAEETVRRALRAYEKRKTVFVPGFLNGAGAFGTRFVGRSLAARLAVKVMGSNPP
jgi:short-subunit dehydrogenase